MDLVGVAEEAEGAGGAQAKEQGDGSGGSQAARQGPCKHIPFTHQDWDPVRAHHPRPLATCWTIFNILIKANLV